MWLFSKKEESKKEPPVRELSSFQKELAEKAQAIIDKKDAIEKVRRDTVEKEVREQIQTILRGYAEKGHSFVESSSIEADLKLSVKAEASQIGWLLKRLCKELGVHTTDYHSHSWNHTIYLIPPK